MPSLSSFIQRDKLFLYGFCLAFGGLVLLCTQLVDEAFLTLRVVDNAIQGYGLRWNTDERVQVYDHPLWLLLNIVAGFVLQSPLFANMVLSFSLLTAALWVASTFVSAGERQKIFFLLLPLLMCRSFREGAASGLEAPLSLLLLALFVRESFREAAVIRLFALAVLMFFTRPELLLLAVPVLAHRAWQQRGTLPLARLGLLLLPVLAWYVFCVFYYGFLLPNASYLTMGVTDDNGGYWQSGLGWLLDFTTYDPWGVLLLLAVASAVVFASYRSGLAEYFQVSAVQRFQLELLLSGMALYMVWVMAGGGDHVRGSLMLNLVFISACLLLLWLRHVPLPRPGWILLGVGVLYAGSYAASYFWIDDTAHQKERYWLGDAMQWSQRYKLAQAPAEGEPNLLVLREHVGFSAYQAGPDVTIINPAAYTDPFIGRVTLTHHRYWNEGEASRSLPEGYLQARATGDITHMPSALQLYYKPLRILVSAPLFSQERLLVLLGFQLWWYEDARHEATYYYGSRPEWDVMLRPVSGW